MNPPFPMLFDPRIEGRAGRLAVAKGNQQRGQSRAATGSGHVAPERDRLDGMESLAATKTFYAVSYLYVIGKRRTLYSRVSLLSER